MSRRLRILLGLLLVGLIASEAMPFDRPLPKAAGSAAHWIATVRFDVTGVIVEAGPHLQVLTSTAMGKAGVPQSQTAGGGTSIIMTITPQEARELADALNAWADNPTDSVVFSRAR